MAKLEVVKKMARSLINSVGAVSMLGKIGPAAAAALHCARNNGTLSVKSLDLIERLTGRENELYGVIYDALSEKLKELGWL